MLPTINKDDDDDDDDYYCYYSDPFSCDVLIAIAVMTAKCLRGRLGILD